MAAFQQHPQWRTVCPAQGQDQDFADADEQHLPSAEATASQLIWAEYERLDWERIYAGKNMLVTDMQPAATWLFLWVHLWRGPEYAVVCSDIAAATSSFS